MLCVIVLINDSHEMNEIINYELILLIDWPQKNCDAT